MSTFPTAIPSKKGISVGEARPRSIVGDSRRQWTLEILEKVFFQATPLWPLRAELS